MSATWPATLPQRMEQSGYSAQPSDNVIRSQMDVGPPKTRRRSIARKKIRNVTIVLTPAQYAIFVAFWNDDLRDGSLPFEWIDPRTEATVVYLPRSVYRERASDYYTEISMSLEELP